MSSNYVMTRGASQGQIFDALNMRNDPNLSNSTKRDLNFIVHSADPNPHKNGYNRFADPNKKYDPNAAKVIEKASK